MNLALLICWQGVLTHYPTDSEVASTREKTEEPHPQALQPKEDGTQSPLPHMAWYSRSAMPLYGVCMGMEHVTRYQQCCIWKIRATVASEPRTPFQAHDPKQTHAYSLCLSHQATSKGHKTEYRKHKPSTCKRDKTEHHPCLFLALHQSVVTNSRYFSPFPKTHTQLQC